MEASKQWCCLWHRPCIYRRPRRVLTVRVSAKCGAPFPDGFRSFGSLPPVLWPPACAPRRFAGAAACLSRLYRRAGALGAGRGLCRALQVARSTAGAAAATRPKPENHRPGNPATKARCASSAKAPCPKSAQAGKILGRFARSLSTTDVAQHGSAVALSSAGAALAALGRPRPACAAWPNARLHPAPALRSPPDRQCMPQLHIMKRLVGACTLRASAAPALQTYATLQHRPREAGTSAFKPSAKTRTAQYWCARMQLPWSRAAQGSAVITGPHARLFSRTADYPLAAAASPSKRVLWLSV